MSKINQLINLFISSVDISSVITTTVNRQKKINKNKKCCSSSVSAPLSALLSTQRLVAQQLRSRVATVYLEKKSMSSAFPARAFLYLESVTMTIARTPRSDYPPFFTSLPPGCGYCGCRNKDPSVEIPEFKGSLFKPWSRSEDSHACFISG